MKILIIDNYDSFTYNLKHYVEPFCDEVIVKRNDDILLEEIEGYEGIIISPGPGLPKDSGITMEAIHTYARSKKILGVCLGHQAIAEYFGAILCNLDEPLHGIPVMTHFISNDKMFEGIPKSCKTGRYHSWVVCPESIENTDLELIATDVFGQVQAMRHKTLNVRSVQFHPESIMTDYGKKMIENWIKI